MKIQQTKILELCQCCCSLFNSGFQCKLLNTKTLFGHSMFQQHPNAELIHAFQLVTWISGCCPFSVCRFAFDANVIVHIICTLCPIYMTVTRSHIRNNKLFFCCFVKCQTSFITNAFQKVKHSCKITFSTNSIRYRPTPAKHSKLHYLVCSAAVSGDCGCDVQFI